MSSATEAPAFRRGARAIDQAQEEQKSRRGGNFADRFALEKDGETAVLRFITDAPETITVDFHSFVPTKKQPSNWKGDNYPGHMGAVCRKDPAFEGLPGFDGSCYICDHIPEKRKGKEQKRYPAARTYALAVLREEHEGNMRDILREIGGGDDDDKKGDKKKVPHIVVVGQGLKNFWSTLRGNINVYGTLVDRDYHIQRVGEDQSTDYRISPLDPIDGVVVGPVPRNWTDDPEGPQIFVEAADWPEETAEVGDMKVRLPSRSWKFGEVVEGDDFLVNILGERIDASGRSEFDGGEPVKGMFTLPPDGAMCRFDLRDPRFRNLYAEAAPDLAAVVMEMASEDHYATFFDPTVEAPSRGSDADGDDKDDDEGRSDGPSAAQLAALRAQVEGYQDDAKDDGGDSADADGDAE